MKKGNLRTKALMELLLAVALLAAVNYIASRVFHRFDFTKEKRYTLSPASEKLAESLEDIVYIKVLLDGEDLLPAYKNLRNACKEMIDEFRYASESKIEYEIVNPLEGLEGEELRNVLLELRNKGIVATDLYEKTNDGSRQKLIVPAALFYYKGREYAMHLIDPSQTVNTPATLNRAVETLEYGIANTLRRCLEGTAKAVAFIQGHEELDAMQTADIRRLLEQNYIVEEMNLNFDDSGFYLQILPKLEGIQEDSLAYAVDRLIKEKLNSYDAIIIAKPRLAFAEREKYWIDQFVMQGGKVLWMLDPLFIEDDTLSRYGKMYTGDYDLNLTDLLFKYGVRVNPTVVQDLSSLEVPFAREGGGVDPKPWFYYTVLPSLNNHAINNNLDPVWLQYPASMDTVGSPGLRKTILLRGTAFGRVNNHPAEIDLQIAHRPPAESYFTHQYVPLAVLVEGRFESPYALANREDLDPLGTFIDHVEDGKMIVVADGDLVNNIIRSDGRIYPAGYDRLSKTTFANREFFMNCMDYLLDDYGLITVRNKEIQLRMLDKDKINLPKEQNKWRTLNMVLPVLLILVFGLINGWIRKMKYER